MLQTTFTELLINYTDNKNLINDLWTEIKINYSNKKRHYHTLEHLKNILLQLNCIKDEIQDWDTILFTLFYHDIIYNTTKFNNEEQSATFAKQRMKQALVDNSKIILCEKQILATKLHSQNTNKDTSYFMDADLSVLGANWDIYLKYSKNVRKEYDIYTDVIYNTGRQKVLNYFLSMDRIFKTEFFYHKFEKQAKHNLQKEMLLLLK